MNEEKAREILGKAIEADGRLYDRGEYLAWSPGNTKATLDGEFSADVLEAIAWWMRRHAQPGSGMKQ